MRRILVLGCSGSGKTTFSLQLSEALGIPVVHLDRLYWKPGWVEPEKTSWRETVAQALEGESWIMDGHFSGTIPMRLDAADTVFLLDFPRVLCLRRVLGRVLKGWGRTRSDMGPGCPERFDLAFLRFIWRFRTERLPGVVSKLKEFRGDVYIVRSPRELRDALARLRPESGSVPVQ
jgi:adenylate kinase family enzyme